MKNNHYLIFLFFATVFTACKKPAPIYVNEPTYFGLWKGTYTQFNVDKPIWILVEDDGDINVYHGADTATTTNTFEGYWIYQPVGPNLVFKYDDDAIKENYHYASTRISQDYKSLDGILEYYFDPALPPTRIGTLRLKKQ